MKLRILPLFLLLAFAAPVATAQSFEVIARATWIDSNGDPGEFENFDDTFSGDFDNEVGYGAALNFYFAERLSVELGATFVEPDIEFVIGESGGAVVESSVEMIPITLGLQYHFSPGGRFDFYLGAGGGYILFDDIDDNPDLALEDVSAIDFDDDFGFMANAGVSIGLFDSIALNIDAKYLDVEPEVSTTFERGDFTGVQNIEFSPVLLSAGVSWRF